MQYGNHIAPDEERDERLQDDDEAERIEFDSLPPTEPAIDLHQVGDEWIDIPF